MENTLDLVEWGGFSFSEHAADCIRSSGSAPVKKQFKRK